MLSTKRRLTGVVLGSLLALGGTAAVPAAAQTPARAGCGIAVNEPHIYQRWSALGGAGGWLGCPTTGTRDVYLNGAYAGKRQYFTYGTATWSPRQGSNMVVAAWEDRGYAYFSWGTTAPEHHYDSFLVRWTSASDPGGTQREFGGGTGGRIRVREQNTGAYVFIVEGCDIGTFGHTCRQGWTLKASTPN